jgi:hypothetical protein
MIVPSLFDPLDRTTFASSFRPNDLATRTPESGALRTFRHHDLKHTTRPDLCVVQSIML